MAQSKYTCPCCDIEFFAFNIGLDVKFVEYNCTLDQDKMVNQKWSNVVNFDELDTWSALWNYICEHRNVVPAMQHLYESYKNVQLDLGIPDNAKLELEYIH